jgi:hypothetical protein
MPCDTRIYMIYQDLSSLQAQAQMPMLWFVQIESMQHLHIYLLSNIMCNGSQWDGGMESGGTSSAHQASTCIKVCQSQNLRACAEERWEPSLAMSASACSVGTWEWHKRRMRQQDAARSLYERLWKPPRYGLHMPREILVTTGSSEYFCHVLVVDNLEMVEIDWNSIYWVNWQPRFPRLVILRWDEFIRSQATNRSPNP